MTTAIAALGSSSIRYAEFVELILTVYAGNFLVGSTYTIFVVGTTDFTAIGASSNTVGVTFTATGIGSGTGKAQQIFTFCNAAGPVTVNGIRYAGYGTYLGVSEIQQDMKASSVDIKISLSGLDINVVSLILSSPVKGSTVKIWRGFLDANNQIETIGGVQQFFQRYQGIINNVAINENFDDQKRERTVVCIVSCASMRLVLDSRLAGIKTNPSNWRFLYPTDTSMDRVPVIASTYFNFGQNPIPGSATKVIGSTQTNPVPLVKFSNT
ncbi:hypothetical protein UFOVP262_6 [uncultured Caudovirales phage]|uniref:Uncharacterized protein n=1 Tax=uncultured Caudovirales phage TaxID=2100421 RepID=A0A6J5L0P1_9CAUD|nr:hypothetical protein UFOVP90_34 [uncultured Caudovirales phage]CAB4133747.1 hypothetical protein UFOVP262_6 [uncultured Caudovirales phage]